MHAQPLLFVEQGLQICAVAELLDGTEERLRVATGRPSSAFPTLCSVSLLSKQWTSSQRAFRWLPVISLPGAWGAHGSLAALIRNTVGESLVLGYPH